MARKSIVARLGLKSGHVLRRQDLDIKRLAVGISPMEIYAVIGKRLTRDVEQDEALRTAMLYRFIKQTEAAFS